MWIFIMGWQWKQKYISLRSFKMTFICSRDQNYSNECGLMFLCRHNFYLLKYFKINKDISLPLIARMHPRADNKEKIENQITTDPPCPADILYLGTVGLNCVMNVDQNQENCHKKSHPARDYLRVHQETVEISYFFDSRKMSSLTWSTRRPQRVPRGGNRSRCRMTFSASGEAGSPWCCNSSLGPKTLNASYRESWSLSPSVPIIKSGSLKVNASANVT